MNTQSAIALYDHVFERTENISVAAIAAIMEEAPTRITPDKVLLMGQESKTMTLGRKVRAMQAAAEFVKNWGATLDTEAKRLDKILEERKLEALHKFNRHP